MHCRSEGLGSVVLRLENIFIDIIIIIFLGIYVTSISLIPLLQIHLGFFKYVHVKHHSRDISIWAKILEEKGSLAE